MRYLLQNVFCDELSARQRYIYQTMSLWTVKSYNSLYFTCLTSIPQRTLDVLFLVGHNMIVKKYLEMSKIPEEVIVAITCDGLIHLSDLRIPGKRIYIPHQSETHYADLIKGSLYGFEFDLTMSEVLFYNNRKNNDIIQRLDSAFYRL